jgi:gluconolactonase
VLVDGLDHPEGVCWDAGAGVVWAGGEAGQLYRVDPVARVAEHAATVPGFVLGLAIDGRGRLVVCADDVFVVEDGRAAKLLDGLTLPNYPAFAPDGTLYVSDSGTWAQDDGRLLRVDRDGAVDVLSDRVNHFTNGLAVSPDGRWLWCVESYEPYVTRFDLQAGDGRPEVIARIDGTVLDGLALTADGGLLVTCYRPDRIYHLDAGGRLEVVAQDPQGTLIAAPTNVCFIGPELDRVVSANLGRWHLTLLDLGLAGVPLHAPVEWAADAGRVAR